MQTNFAQTTYTQRQIIRIKTGFCARCGEPRGDDGTLTRCRPCADLMSRITCLIKKKKIRKKLCRHCSAPLEENCPFRLCEKCAVRNREKQRLRLSEREQKGLCKNCSEPSPLFKYCFRCREKRSARDRARYANRTPEQIKRDRRRWRRRGKKKP